MLVNAPIRVNDINNNDFTLGLLKALFATWRAHDRARSLSWFNVWCVTLTTRNTWASIAMSSTSTPIKKARERLSDRHSIRCRSLAVQQGLARKDFDTFVGCHSGVQCLWWVTDAPRWQNVQNEFRQGVFRSLKLIPWQLWIKQPKPVCFNWKLVYIVELIIWFIWASRNHKRLNSITFSCDLYYTPLSNDRSTYLLQLLLVYFNFLLFQFLGRSERGNQRDVWLLIAIMLIISDL